MGNWIDNLIGFISPEAGARRMAWRLEMKRYDATESTNSRWSAYNAGAEVDDKWSREVIRAKARDLERNSDIAQSLIFSKLRNITGKGFSLQAQTGNEELNNKIEEAWRVWKKKQYCDVTGTQSFDEILEMAVRRKFVDGGMLIKKCYVHDAELVPFKLQCIDVDELDNSMVTATTLANGNKVSSGVEFDKYHRPRAYYLKQYDVDGMQTMTPVRVDAKDIIFYFTKHRPSQIREISDLTPTINRVRDANEFMTAVSVKERIQACLGVFIKKALPQGGIGRSSGVGKDGVKYQGKTLVPGMISELNAGDSIETVNPNGNGSEATEFIKLQYKLISAGQGMSYESTSRDMSGSTYSSARQNIVEDEVTFNTEIRALKENVMSEIYTTFVISGVLCGLFDIPDFWANKYKYLKHEWVTGAKRWIDPSKEASANYLAVKSGQKSYKEIANENGKDWKEQLNDIAEVNKYAKELGLKFTDADINEIGGQDEPKTSEEDTGQESGSTGEE